MERLFVYGTLAPGRPNEHVLAHLDGTWAPAVVTGELVQRGWGVEHGYPALALHPDGPAVAGLVLSADGLESQWDALDAFEGPGYERVRTTAILEDGTTLDAWVYVDRAVPTSPTVRRATAEDAAGLSRLAALTFPLACTPQTSPDTLSAHIAAHLGEDHFRAHLRDPDRVLLLAVDGTGSDPVGYTMLVAGEPTDPDVVRSIKLRPTVELARCYVHPDHHGAGTATLLMEASLAAARERGARGAWLGVSEENARANAFYARHGFEQVGTKRFHIGDVWEKDLVRERAL